jgi:transposase-like protein
VAAKVGCHAETLRLWLRDAECDDGPAHEEQARIKGNRWGGRPSGGIDVPEWVC